MNKKRKLSTLKILNFSIILGSALMLSNPNEANARFLNRFFNNTTPYSNSSSGFRARLSNWVSNVTGFISSCFRGRGERGNRPPNPYADVHTSLSSNNLDIIDKMNPINPTNPIPKPKRTFTYKSNQNQNTNSNLD